MNIRKHWYEIKLRDGIDKLQITINKHLNLLILYIVLWMCDILYISKVSKTLCGSGCMDEHVPTS